MNILIVDDEASETAAIQNAVERVSPGHVFWDADCADAAMLRMKDHPIDVVFLDVRMPGKDGLVLAGELRELYPRLNIVIATAHAEYALEAHKLFVSGYVVKPVSDADIRCVLENLRYPVADSGAQSPADCRIRCFGNFEIFVNGERVSFQRTRAKEILAFLVCLHGSSASFAEICTMLFEDKANRANSIAYTNKLLTSLKTTLKNYGAQQILQHSRNAYALDVNRIRCDYWEYLEGRLPDGYHGVFMYQYSWAEQYIWDLNEKRKTARGDLPQRNVQAVNQDKK